MDYTHFIKTLRLPDGFTPPTRLVHDDVPAKRAPSVAIRQWENPANAGFSFSRPVSRILSRVTISLGGVPGSSAGRVNGICFTLHRTGFG